MAHLLPLPDELQLCIARKLLVPGDHIFLLRLVETCRALRHLLSTLQAEVQARRILWDHSVPMQHDRETLDMFKYFNGPQHFCVRALPDEDSNPLTVVPGVDDRFSSEAVCGVLPDTGKVSWTFTCDWRAPSASMFSNPK